MYAQPIDHTRRNRIPWNIIAISSHVLRTEQNNFCCQSNESFAEHIRDTPFLHWATHNVYKPALSASVHSTTMHRWAGRVAMVTGASSGIGAAITKELVKKGLKVVGMARRVENIEVSSQVNNLSQDVYLNPADREQLFCSRSFPTQFPWWLQTSGI